MTKRVGKGKDSKHNKITTLRKEKTKGITTRKIPSGLVPRLEKFLRGSFANRKNVGQQF